MLVNEYSWIKNSLILTNEDECLPLFKMTRSSTGRLLYRATRDGFTAEAFHLKCDGKENTLTIIRNNLDYVFGGYTTAKWLSDKNLLSIQMRLFLV